MSLFVSILGHGNFAFFVSKEGICFSDPGVSAAYGI